MSTAALAPPDRALVDVLCTAARSIPGPARAVADSVVARLAPLADGADRDTLVAAVLARLVGLGSIAELLDDPAVDEVLVNGGAVWVERAGELTPYGRIDDDEVAVVLERILAPIGRRLDLSQPIVDARLADGSRVCAVIAPVAVDGTCVAIRRPARRILDVGDFCSPPVAALLAELVEVRANIVVSGATSSGKTTLLAALMRSVPVAERIVVIEDTTELITGTDHHVVRLEARRAHADGLAAIELSTLVRTALRLRPDRLVVGEVRGDEVVAMVQAMNTGHDGSLSTCHANSALDALHRLETLVMQASPTWPLPAVREQLTRSIDAVVHVVRGRRGARHVAEVVEVVASTESPTVRTLAVDDLLTERPTRGRR